MGDLDQQIFQKSFQRNGDSRRQTASNAMNGVQLWKRPITCSMYD